MVVAEPTTPPGYPEVPPSTNEVPYDVMDATYTLTKTRTFPENRPAIIGETVTFEIVVENDGEAPLETVPVEDTYETDFLTYVSSEPASDDNDDDGTINWADIGPLEVGESATIVATFTAKADTFGTNHTNTVVTTPTTPTNYPGVPPQTNEAPYQVDTPASLGDYVWLDKNADGIQDAGEVGISNIVVNLYGAETNLVGTTTTDANGKYAFTNLVPGTYLVGFETTTNLHLSPKDSGSDDAEDSDADPDTGYSDPVTLGSGEENWTLDAGMYELARLGDYVWLDTNGDGIQDSTEAGISNVTVYLYGAASNVQASTTTDASGYYAFTNLVPGTYFVGFELPAGYQFTLQDQGGDDTADSDADPDTGQTTLITLESGQDDPTWDAGMYIPASLGDYVWLDANGDGIQDSTEAGISNVTVHLYDAASNVLESTTTDASGYYAFTNLVPGTYFVGFELPAGYQFTLQDQGGDDTADSDADRTTGWTAPTTLVSGQNDLTWDAGIYQPASLGDYVWLDKNADGIQDAGEVGISNIVVNLYDAETNLVGTTITDAAGNYLFDNLIPGEYQLKFIRPAGYKFTQQDVGGDDAVDSDADPDTGQTAKITLVSGQNDLTWDAGIYQPASVGDYVWLDENWDGVQDPGEPGIPNVVIELLDEDANVIATTITDLNGKYLFSDLTPGTYTVRIDTNSLPPNVVDNPTYDPDGGNDHQSEVTLASGEKNLLQDFGYNWRPEPDPNTPLLGAIGDRVWLDTDGNGVQDPGEAGIPGVVVELYVDDDGDGIYDTLVATTTTDAAGNYLFTDLEADSYVVRVEPNSLPPGLVQTGDPDHFGTDSSVNPSQAGDHETTAPIILAPGDVFLNADFGYMPPTPLSNLGDLIFFDANADGEFNPDDGDYAIPGVTVVLLDSNGVIIASTVTTGDHSATNNYLFTGLPAGEYTVWVNDTAGVLNGLVQTADPDEGFDRRSTTVLDGENDDLRQDHGFTADRHEEGLGLIGDTIFLDRDNDGLPGPGEGIEGVTVYLYDTNDVLLASTVTDPNGIYTFGGLELEQTYVVRVDTNTLPNGGVGLVNTVDPDTPDPGDSESRVTITSDHPIDLDQDFGYVPQGGMANAIGGTVWYDCNADGTLDDEEEIRVEGVQIVLRDAVGHIVGTTFTDADGDYLFENLPDGTYSLEVNDINNRLHGHWTSVGPNPGMDNNSQAKPYTVSVAGGETNTTGDFGYYLIQAELGDYVWYDINSNGLQEGGEPGLANVKVTLTIEYPDGTEIVMHTLTDSTGWYRFANLLLDDRYHEGTDGDPAAEGKPRFTVSLDVTQAVLIQDGYEVTAPNRGNGFNDSRDSAGNIAMVTRCDALTHFDFGFRGGPLLAVIGHVDAYTRDGQTIVRWETVEMWNSTGFWLERQVDGEWIRVSQDLLAYPLFAVAPVVFEEVDPDAVVGETYTYRLVELENSGNILYYGPYELTVNGPGHTYEDWAVGHFTPEELADSSISGRDSDPDGDGLTNWQEFLAGTDPRNGNSVLRIQELKIEGDEVEVSWQSVPGMVYKVAIATSMSAEQFLPLPGTYLATGTITTESFFFHPDGRQLYFQIIVIGSTEE